MSGFAVVAKAEAADTSGPGIDEPTDWPTGWTFPGPPWPPGFEDGTPWFSAPSPSDDATSVDVDSDLSWTFSGPGATYEVMFNDVVVGTSSTAAYTLDALDNETEYTWRVFATVGGVTYVSPEWSFTTASGLIYAQKNWWVRYSSIVDGTGPAWPPVASADYPAHSAGVTAHWHYSYVFTTVPLAYRTIAQRARAYVTFEVPETAEYKLKLDLYYTTADDTNWTYGIYKLDSFVDKPSSVAAADACYSSPMTLLSSGLFSDIAPVTGYSNPEVSIGELEAGWTTICLACQEEIAGEDPGNQFPTLSHTRRYCGLYASGGGFYTTLERV